MVDGVCFFDGELGAECGGGGGVDGAFFGDSIVGGAGVGAEGGEVEVYWRFGGFADGIAGADSGGWGDRVGGGEDDSYRGDELFGTMGYYAGGGWVFWGEGGWGVGG